METKILADPDKNLQHTVQNLMEEMNETAGKFPPGLMHRTEEILRQTREQRFEFGTGVCLRILGQFYLFQSNFQQAREMLDEAVGIFRDLDDNYELVKCRNAISKIYNFSGNFRQVIENAESCKVVLEEHHDFSELASCYNDLGIAHHRLDNIRGAIVYFEKSAALYLQLGRKLQYSRVIFNCSNCYERIGNYEKAMELLYKALDIAQETEDLNIESRISNNLGIIFREAGELEKAQYHFEKSIQLKRTLHDRHGEANTLSNLFELLTDRNELRKAQEYALESMAIYESLGDQFGMANLMAHMAAASLKAGELDLAARQIEKGMENARQFGFKKVQLMLQMHRASWYELKKETDKAIAENLSALTLSEEILGDTYRSQIHYSLYRIYRDNKELELALQHFMAFHELENKRHEDQKISQIKFLETLHKLENSQLEKNIVELQNKELSRALQHTEGLKDQALRENEMKTELLDMAVHDLLNPLSGIIGFTDLIIKYRQNPEEVLEFANQISLASRSMSKLIHDLLEISALEKGRLELNREKVSLNVVFKRVINKNLPQSVKKQIDILLNDYETVFVHGDKDRLEEIFDNLISNALKYSNPKSGITITVRQEGKLAIVDIRDNGLGLTSEDLKRIFLKFEKLSSRPTGGESSIGLGLSITKKLVELHGGHISASSEGKKKGSTFTVTLPAAE